MQIVGRAQIVQNILPIKGLKLPIPSNFESTAKLEKVTQK